MRIGRFQAVVIFLGSIALSGCVSTAAQQVDKVMAEPPSLTVSTASGEQLADLPPPKRPVDVAVYGFSDETGQQKPSDNFAEFSKAVTQGSENFLIDAFKRAGHGKWFRVVERVGLKNLLQERNIIEQSRQRYNMSGSGLPPLRFAGMLIEGGIVSYDSNDVTGGIGARYLGIGADTKYRRDVVTVALRAVSVSTGEVLTSVTTSKTIYSSLVHGGAFTYVAVDEILEAEAGYSRNEPVGLAVRQAIELGVYSLIMKGAERNLWSFRDPVEGAHLISQFKQKYNEELYGMKSIPAS